MKTIFDLEFLNSQFTSGTIEIIGKAKNGNIPYVVITGYKKGSLDVFQSYVYDKDLRRLAKNILKALEK